MEVLKNNIDAIEVVDFLSDNLDFFTDKDELLEKMYVHHTSPSTISLLERQLEIARKKNKSLEKKLVTFLANAKQNEQTNVKLDDLIIALIATNGFDDISATLSEHMKNSFNVVYSALLPVADINQKLVDIMENVSNDSGVFQARVGKDHEKYLFADLDEKILSFACVRLVVSGIDSMWVLGSTEEDRYQESSGTLFLEKIAKVIKALSCDIRTPSAE